MDDFFELPSERLDMRLLTVVAARPGQYAAPPSLVADVVGRLVREIPLPERAGRCWRWRQAQGAALRAWRWN